MQASSFWKWFIGTVDSGDLADLRRDMILEVGVAAFVIGWLATLVAIGYGGRLEYLPTALILLAGSMASFLLRPTHYQVALHVLIATVLCAITCLKWFVADSLAQYYFPVAIVVSSLLVPSGRVFVLAVIASLACMAVARSQNANWLDSANCNADYAHLSDHFCCVAWFKAGQHGLGLGCTIAIEQPNAS